ncbi:inositol phosphophingolipids phospholipase C [Laccaria bicolor S238N-H82]|uniref:Inositol phosphophingolipids phospholipase C n=1 Tax=Laccaria bicolor (strain S238N-H82 / ATCC MYA-4686) TaxID=486041 RepID=B0CRL6_LACBS|nr:inositol phosphophingolipids phospholipase C [Laccaria bicolor S238N-H82]EDR15838.1 inositol phosphophingolipids phospholipase C [Laccaria bicolor S238N-H82]|eukprot:XP_001874046.1 inositol phosphophingolipids phospholipase C [Laccaria bicolor S238N-H82]
MSESEIRLLSLNCWGLKYVAKNRTERIQAIARFLADSDHDIVALQEIWVFADYEHVLESVSKRLPHSKFFYSGALGAGLAIFTRFPIVTTSVNPYSLNGSPIDVAAGDWFVGKAAASVTILHPVLGHVQIFNTHLFAKGGEDGPEYNRAHRLVNAWEFAKLTRQAAERGRYVIALGDFNSIPPTLPMTVIRDHASLTDSWVVTHPNPDATSVTNALEAITKLGITADSPLNSYSAAKGYAAGSWGKRLDYVLYRQPERHQTSPGQTFPLLKAKECKVVLTDPVPGYNFSYSDHFGLDATLHIEASDVQNAEASKELSNASIATTIQALTACYRFSRERSRKELVIFALCIILLLAIIIGSAWLPHSWINPIFMLFTVFIAWLATTMLYEGFLYGNWECNALMNVIEELEIYRKGLDIQSGVQRDVGDYVG